ncbi:MAG: C1 family peptidase [Planctomycetota bacterium]|jgi:hypothetical protein
MKDTNGVVTLGAAASVLVVAAASVTADPPSAFDLRDVEGVNYVTSVKSQQGGTCWTHGAMAAMEGNLLMTGAWAAAEEVGEPNLAEYHLDWWNGFNQHCNDDDPGGGGLIVHEGGDYRVTSAYLSRCEGAVRDIDGQSFSTPPLRSDPSYHCFYPRDIEWYVAQRDLSNINLIKEKIMSEGVLGTCLCSNGAFLSGTNHYQPPDDPLDPNHAVAIIGWDDSRVTQAPQPGAWLVKNSWGSSWGEDGYFWISYYDKHCCQHPEMGAISFQDVEPLAYDMVYYHDYHGWRDTKMDTTEAFNAFTAFGGVEGVEVLKAVSFFTAVDAVTYTVIIYDRFEGGELMDVLSTKSGTIEYTGYHTVDLNTTVALSSGDDFYIYLSLSDGGHPYARTSDVPVLLGASYRTIVESAADREESYYRSGGVWLDLYDWTDPPWDHTANFCIKGLSSDEPLLAISFPNGRPEYVDPGLPTPVTVQIAAGMETYVPGTGTLHCRDDGGSFQALPLTPLGGDLFEALLPGALCEGTPEYYISARSDGGSTVLSPVDAPASVYTAIVGTLTITAQDDFESDLGWTAENLGASSGDWQRGVPVNDPGWDYDPISDSDGSGQCYLTQNEMGNTDVDDGAVRLTSPSFDMAGGGSIAYDYYLYLTNNDGSDRLLVEVNNTGGMGEWTEVTRHDTSGELNWRHHEISEDDLIAVLVPPTAEMHIRFTANDADAQSIVEAGIDGFVVMRLDCENPCPADLSGDGVVNVSDFLLLLAAWGTPDGDIDGDGDTGITDFLQLLGAWGPCP